MIVSHLIVVASFWARVSSKNHLALILLLMHSLVLEVDPESPRTVFFAVKLFLVAATVAPTCPHLSCSFSLLLDANFCSASWGEKTLYDMVKANHPSIDCQSGY
jgi:hypothetical protein